MNKNQHQSKNRSRGRGSARRGPNRGNSYESSGPEVKVRGSAQQVLDKYLQLARDAQLSGDRVNAENYLQYAEHYYRIINADSQEQANRSQNAGRTPAQEGSGENEPEQVKSGSGASDGRQSSKQRSRGSHRAAPKGRQQREDKSESKSDTKAESKPELKDGAKKVTKVAIKDVSKDAGKEVDKAEKAATA